MDTTFTPVLILGGGIAGLTAAWHLRKKNIPFLLMEQSGRVGGVMQSDHTGGFTIENGPNSISLTPALQQLITDLQLGAQVEEAAPVSKNRYLLRGSRLVPVSPHPLKILTSPYLSAKAKWRLFTERFVKPLPREEEESVADFFGRRLGKEIAESVIDPVLSGIYAGDISRLSIRQVMPALVQWEKELGSLTKGLMQNKAAMGGRKMITFAGGSQTLTGAIYREVKDQVWLQAGVQKVARAEKGYMVTCRVNGEEKKVMTDKIICTLPAYSAAAVLEEADAAVAAALKGIVYPEVWELHAGFDRPAVGAPLDGFGFLVAQREQRSFLGCIFSSSVFPSTAPEGKVLFTLFIGGARQQPLIRQDAGTVVRQAIQELQEILSINAPPCFEHLQVWKQAIPQFNLGYDRIKAVLSDFERRQPGFYFGGNYVAGVSVGDVVRQAAGIVEKCFP